MASVNRVILVGNLGNDPELRTTPEGQKVCSFSMATADNWTDKNGQKQEKTQWHRITVWGRQGENCAQYLSKGRQIYVEGKISYRQWDDKETGQKRYATDIIAATVQFLGSLRSESEQRQTVPGPAAEAVESSSFTDNDIPF